MAVKAGKRFYISTRTRVVQTLQWKLTILELCMQECGLLGVNLGVLMMEEKKHRYIEQWMVVKHGKRLWMVFQMPTWLDLEYI